MGTNKQTKSSIFFDILFTYAILYELLPVVRVYSPHGLSLLSLFLIFIYLFINQKNILQTYGKVFVIYIFELIPVVEAILDLSFCSVFKEFRYYIHYLVIPLGIFYYIDNDFKPQVKLVFVISLFCLAVTTITTYVGNIIFPNASRMIAGNGIAEEMGLSTTLSQYNIDGFCFVYIMVMMIPYLVWVAKNKLVPVFPKFGVLITFSLCVFILIMVNQTEYTTAFLFAVLSMILFVCPKEFNAKRLGLFCIILVIAFILVRAFIPTILTELAQHTDSSQIQQRLNDMAAMMQGTTTEGEDVEGRKEFFLMSVNNFLSSPIIGTGNNGGGHSFIFDHLSQFGLLGLICVAAIFVKLFRLTIKPFECYNGYGFMVFLFLVQILLSTVNTAVMYNLFFLVLLPTSYLLEKSYNSLNYE